MDERANRRVRGRGYVCGDSGEDCGAIDEPDIIGAVISDWGNFRGISRALVISRNRVCGCRIIKRPKRVRLVDSGILFFNLRVARCRDIAQR